MWKKDCKAIYVSLENFTLSTNRPEMLSERSGISLRNMSVCTTFVVIYQKLKEFEDDRHKHIHLERNILFPKAARL